MPPKSWDIDPEAFFAAIQEAGERPTPLERHQDFQQLFLGTDQGRRVLRHILIWARLWKTSFHADSHVAAFMEGERNMGLKILTAINVEPKPLPTRATKRPKGE